MIICRVFRIFMAPARMAILKFIGTVSLGLLTGMSYALTTVTIPSILSLPSSSAAAKALASLTTLTQQNLHTLARIATAAFLLAYASAPRTQRHPYLIYTSLLAAASGAAPLISPHIFGEVAVSLREKQKSQNLHHQQQHRPLEASYEDLGDAGFSASESLDDTEVNGEEVRALAQNYVKTRVVETGFSSMAFALAVIGIWGDGSSVV